MKALTFDKLPTDPVGDTFRLPFARAIEEAARRRVELPAHYYGGAISAARAVSFTVGGLASLDQVGFVLDSLNKSLEEGGTFADWKKAVQDADLRLPAHRLELIFRNHMQTAYNRGRCQNHNQHLDARPYLLYSAINDARTRPAHHAMDGFIAKHDDPIWQKWKPQNGHNCRCSVISLSEAQAVKMGISQAYPGAEPDPGWAYDPCANPDEGAERAIARKVGQMPPAFKKSADKIKRGAMARVRMGLDDLLAAGGRAVHELLSEAAKLDDGALLWQSFDYVLTQRLAATRGAGTKKLKIAAGAQTKGGQYVTRAAAMFPASWIERANGLGRLHVTTARGRAHHYTLGAAYDGADARLQGFGVVRGLKQGDGFLTARDLRSAVHEFSHRLQYAMPDLDDFFQELHVRRTAGERLQSLRTLTGIRYSRREVARPDKYLNAYQGREYPAVAGESYLGRAGAKEVMTMAMEWVLGGNSAMLKRLADDDIEMLNLTVALLLHFDP